MLSGYTHNLHLKQFSGCVLRKQAEQKLTEECETQLGPTGSGLLQKTHTLVLLITVGMCNFSMFDINSLHKLN